MKSKRIIACCLLTASLLSVLSAFSSCRKMVPPTENPDTPQNEGSVDFGQRKDVTIVKDGTGIAAGGVGIVIPEDASEAENDLAIAVQTAITEAAGVSLHIGTELSDDKETQIVIGMNVYAPAKDLYAQIAYGQWNMLNCGNKLLIAFAGGEAEKSAEKSVSNCIKRLGKEGELTVTTAFYGMQTVTKTASLFPYLLKRDPDYVQAVGGLNASSDSAQMGYENASPDEYQKALSLLSESGAEKIAENTIADNLFSTFKWRKQLLNVAFYPQISLIRIVSEPLPETLLYGDMGGERKYPVVLAQPAQIKDSTLMAIVLRLADGRFFLYDTGEDYTAEPLMEYMRANNVFTDGKIHVAGIMISHPHPDHMNGLTALAEKYAAELDVDYVLFNFVAKERQSHVSEKTLAERRAAVTNAAKKLGAEAITVRGGQKFTFAGTTFDLLFTPDELGTYFLSGTNEKGESDTSYDLNNSSLLLRMEESGQYTVLTGDCRGGEAQIFLSMYPNKDLKADVMSVAHHSFNVSVTSKIYSMMRPKVLIWTAPYDLVDRTRSFTKTLESASYVKEHYYEDTLTELTLPYQPK